nr:sucrose-phosphatase 1-like isoform X4 [Physcomitrium patens]|eukprot:XP_024363221.1 sucrose-phosphatase 1-like isoform X4 [Physcomitrella patens]
MASLQACIAVARAPPLSHSPCLALLARALRPIRCTLRPQVRFLSGDMAMDWSFNWTAQGVSFRRGEMRFRVSLKEEASVDAKDQRVGAKAIPKLMLVSDLDNTMVDHLDKSHTGLLRFNNLWAAEYAHNSLLVFSTGRSLEKYTQLRTQFPLLTPALCIFSVGTEICYGANMEPDQDWVNYLNEGWNQAVVLEEVKRLNLRLQDDSEIRPHKVSCQIDKKDATEIIDTLSKRLKDRGLNVKLIFSHGIDLDVLPKGAGKGEALAFLLQKMRREGSAPQETLVCGDSGNDIELFEVEGVNGVIVGGAMEELRQWYDINGKHSSRLHLAKERCASGIVEAIGELSLGPHLSPFDRMNSNGIQPAVKASEKGQLTPSGVAQREVVEFNTFFTKWMNGEVPNNPESFQRLTSVIASGSTMVYPWGVEQSLLQSVTSAQSKHGLTKDKKIRVWIDCIQEQELANGVLMVTWHSWQMSEA